MLDVSLYRRIRRLLRPIKEGLLYWSWTLDSYIKFLSKRASRLGSESMAQGRDFFILCVDRPIYAPLVKMNINSLHLQNPNHRVAVYCDPVCHRALSRMRFFYPGQVVFNEYFKDGGSRPWQEKKLDVLKEAVKIGAALVDADTIWNGDPVWDEESAVFEGIHRKIQDTRSEEVLVGEMLKRSDWLEFNHYVVGFVYLPRAKINEMFWSTLLGLTRKIANCPELPGLSMAETISVRRTMEELALSLLIQDLLPREQIAIVRDQQHPADSLMKSLYYGVTHGIN